MTTEIDGRSAAVADDHPAGGAFTAPWAAPPYGRFPLRFRNCWILTAAYRTDPAAIRRLLPPPLEPAGDVVLIQTYEMPDIESIGRANECNIMVGARLETAEGAVAGGFSSGVYLDSDAGTAHGREVHGQPKKHAAVRLEVRGDLLVGTVSRNGIDIVTVTMPFKREPADRFLMSKYFDNTENLNYKLISGIDGLPAIRQLTARRLTDVVVDQCWTGPVTVELRPNAQAPVHQLPVLEPLDGLYWHADFSLVPGRVLHDYLKQEDA